MSVVGGGGVFSVTYVFNLVSADRRQRQEKNMLPSVMRVNKWGRKKSRSGLNLVPFAYVAVHPLFISLHDKGLEFHPVQKQFWNCLQFHYEKDVKMSHSLCFLKQLIVFCLADISCTDISCSQKNTRPNICHVLLSISNIATSYRLISGSPR